MNARPDTDPYARWDAAYVLGSLSSVELLEYQDHLEGCAACREAVGELSAMPALLAKLSPAEVAHIDEPADEFPANGGYPQPVPAGLRKALLDRVALRRKRFRLVTWSLSAAAAAAVAVVVILIAGPRASIAPPEPLLFTMSHVVPSTYDATFSLTERDWGTLVEMSCTYFESEDGDAEDGHADTLAMVVVGRDGSETVLATWTAHTGQTAEPTASTALTMDQIAALRIVEIGSSEVLLQRSL